MKQRAASASRKHRGCRRWKQRASLGNRKHRGYRRWKQEMKIQMGSLSLFVISIFGPLGLNPL
jgi:hypothetical protein